MASAVPVAFAVESPNDPVLEARCGLSVAPEDPEGLAKAIIKLFEMSGEERRAMGQRGRKYVEKHHAIPVLAEKLIQCIEQVEKQ